MHVGFPDPAKAAGTEAEILTVFRRVRDGLRERLGDLLREKLRERRERS
jgi:arsenate reductase